MLDVAVVPDVKDEPARPCIRTLSGEADKGHKLRNGYDQQVFFFAGDRASLRRALLGLPEHGPEGCEIRLYLRYQGDLVGPVNGSEAGKSGVSSYPNHQGGSAR